jgi:hypothetical protein
MSNKYDETSESIDELILAEEQLLEEVVEQGPTPSLVPMVGTCKNVVQRYSHCGICGGRLHFNYVTDFSRNTTHEKSSCPECGLDAKQVLHRLQ